MFREGARASACHPLQEPGSWGELRRLGHGDVDIRMLLPLAAARVWVRLALA